MENSHHDRAQALQSQAQQWQHYKQLELIPDSVTNPSTHQTVVAMAIASSINWLWQGFIHTISNELSLDQQQDYLEHCWDLNTSLKQKPSSPGLFQLWIW
jgi:hypothetical protein